jgi:hypothetical protein
MFATHRRAETAEQAWLLTLRMLVDDGLEVPGQGPSRELLGFDVVLEEPRRRIIANSVRPLPIVGAVARFVWMMAGNDRLEDIAFYEPLVRHYSDDGLVVPGSNYGARLRYAGAQTDQVRGAISRLRGADAKADGGLRRAANVIWRPEDAVRPSSDIPCAFGIFYSPRDDKLITQLVMRSNNALSLLPFNIFEFSLLGEVVAVHSDLELGAMRVEAASMHLYTRDAARAAQILSAGCSGEGPEMPAMPLDPPPLEQINLLAQREARMRHEQARLRSGTAVEMRALGDGLHQYWMGFLEVLLAHAAERAGNSAAADELAAGLPDHFSKGVQAHLRKLREAPSMASGQGSLFAATDAKVPALSEEVRKATSAPGRRPEDVAHIHRLLDDLETEGLVLSRREGLEVIDRLADQRTRAFARSEEGGGPSDYALISKEEVRAAIRELGFER